MISDVDDEIDDDNIDSGRDLLWTLVGTLGLIFTAVVIVLIISLLIG